MRLFLLSLGSRVSKEQLLIFVSEGSEKKISDSGYELVNNNEINFVLLHTKVCFIKEKSYPDV